MSEETKAAKGGEPRSEEREETKQVEVPKKFQDLVKSIEEMSVLDLSELVKILEDKFGVAAAMPMMAAPAAGAGEGVDTAAPEKSVYTIELTDAGSQKIAVIKAVRAVTELGLKDAKDMVDKVPATIKENVPKEEAEAIKKQLEEAGGKVELK
jgi:large subunit ribosomal protein L7/L12